MSDFTDGVVTDEQYVAHQDPRLQAMRQLNKSFGEGSVPDFAAREALAAQLAELGIDVDGQIMVQGHDAQMVMAYRAYRGIVWQPSFEQPIPDPESLMLAGPVPPHAIATITDPAAYPPFQAAPTPTPASTSPVGDKSSMDGVYGVNMSVVYHNGAWIYPEGASVPYQGLTLFFHKYRQAFFGTAAAQWETADARNKRLAEEGTALPDTGAPTGGAVEVKP